MATWQIVVSGRVQGVGYRAACAERARQLGLTGWVRNRLDGSVEALAQGAEASLDALRDWMRSGPPGARVDACEAHPLPESREAFSRFAIHPSA